MTTRSPAHDRLVGDLLRHLRTQSGYSLDDAAAVLGCHRSKISRMETGQRGIQPMELHALLGEFGLDAADRHMLLTFAEHGRDPRWRRSYSRDVDAYQDLLPLAGPGAAMWLYETELVPGLLQTEDYARAIADAVLPGAGRDAREQFVRSRLGRQQILARGEGAPRFSVILGEAVLQQAVGNRTVMSGQLRRLAEVSENQPNVTVQVLPFASVARAGSAGPFTLIWFPGPGHPAVVCLPGPTVGVCLDDDEDVARYSLIFQHLRTAALPPTESARLIEDVAQGK